jgi:hypothetical protein
MAAPEATFFVFLFHLFPASSFYHKCNRSPPLENYKRGGMGHLTRRTHTRLIKNTHLTKLTHTPLLKRPVIRFLSRKLVTPTMITPVQGNTSNSRIHWT